jgi:hypothetical protein
LWSSRNLGLVIVLGTRAKSQPSPARFMVDALTDPHRDPTRPWLDLLVDEVEPEILEATDTVVVWSSIWSARPTAQIRFDIVSEGPAGCLLRWTLSDVDDPGPALVGRMGKRLNVLINAQLRYSFGQ